MPWLALLTNKWVLGAIGVALLLGTVEVQTLRLNHAKKDQIDPATKVSWQAEERRDGPALVVAQRNLATCEGNQQAEEAALARQGAAVAALGAQSAADTARAARAAQQAANAAQGADKLAAAILAPHSDHSCEAANTLIDGSLP